MNQRRAQVTTAIVFTAHGVVSGSFATRVPWIQHHLDIGAGQLGLALLAPALGSILAPPIAGAIAGRFGTRQATRGGLAALCALLALPALAPSLWGLFGVLLGFGIASGIADVSMKSQATSLERGTGKSVMSRLHGLWSVGTLIGAGIGTYATATGIDARLHLSTVAVILTALALFATSGLAHDIVSPSAEPSDNTSDNDTPRRRLPRPGKSLLIIGGVGFCAAFAEAAAHSWSSVYIAALPGVPKGFGAAGFALFVASMAIGRFCGDSLVRRFGPVRVVRLGASLAVAGITMIVGLGELPFVMLGFGLTGLGVSTIVPIVVSAASRNGADPKVGVFTVVTMTYAACLASPGLMGGISDSLSMAAAFTATGGITVLIVVFAGTLSPQPTNRIVFTNPSSIGAKLVTSLTKTAKFGQRRITYAKTYPETGIAHSFAGSNADASLAITLQSTIDNDILVSFVEPADSTPNAEDISDIRVLPDNVAPLLTARHDTEYPTTAIHRVQEDTIEIPRISIDASV